jgi:hypothetical protein
LCKLESAQHNNVSCIIQLHFHKFRQFEYIFPQPVYLRMYDLKDLYLVPAWIFSYQYDVSWQIQLHLQRWLLRRKWLNHFPTAAFVKHFLDRQDWNPINIVDPRSTFFYRYFCHTWYNIMWDFSGHTSYLPPIKFTTMILLKYWWKWG